jgi:hypothetical protein
MRNTVITEKNKSPVTDSVKEDLNPDPFNQALKLNCLRSARVISSLGFTVKKVQCFFKTSNDEFRAQDNNIMTFLKFQCSRFISNNFWVTMKYLTVIVFNYNGQKETNNFIKEQFLMYEICSDCLGVV